ncbi:MAG: hypothetical protein H5T86_01200 [Armatimonadetes bacterium]|nr:hypothetical protein [Armatimonadota bacterium]
MTPKELPESIRKRIAAIERRTGRRIFVRGAKWPDSRLKGRVSERAGAVIVEYRDETAGYFWHIDIIDELLDHVEQGQYEIELVDNTRRSIRDTERLGPGQ